MKYLSATILFLSFLCCSDPDALSYEEGLAHCRQKKAGQANGLGMVSAECIIGAQIPAFKATSMDGQAISDATLKGKVSVINFWFTTCAPCVAEIPGFNAIVDRFGKDNINCVAIGRDSQQDVAEFLTDHPWKFEQIADAGKMMLSAFKLQWGFPTTFVLNKDGVIIYAASGGRSDSTAVQDIQEKLIPVIEKAL